MEVLGTFPQVKSDTTQNLPIAERTHTTLSPSYTTEEITSRLRVDVRLHYKRGPSPLSKCKLATHSR